MQDVADASLTTEEMAGIETHLHAQYRGVFDEPMIAAHLREYVSSAFAENLAAAIAAVCRAGETLLDVGAGYGAFVLACRRRGIEATGLELADFEVGVSRQRLARAEPRADTQLVFQKGDGGRLPFPDSAFGVVSLLNVLEHVPNYRAVLAEAVRVLRPGGKLLVICPNYAALRREAHYHVVWLPFFPRRLASVYLRFRGRNPKFFEQHVYYCTNWGILYALGKLDLHKSDLDLIRIERPALFSNARAARILNALRRARALPLIRIALRINFYNPFKSAVTIIADKKAGL